MRASSKSAAEAGLFVPLSSTARATRAETERVECVVGDDSLCSVNLKPWKSGSECSEDAPPRVRVVDPLVSRSIDPPSLQSAGGIHLADCSGHATAIDPRAGLLGGIKREGAPHRGDPKLLRRHTQGGDAGLGDNLIRSP